MNSNKIYFNEKVLNDEKEYFINNTWILAGHKNELLNNNDFISFDYFGNKVFIQNFNGDIKCFDNVCLHRFNTIHKEPFGNRVPSCLYHHWTYGKKGNVIGVKNPSSFVKEQVSTLKLKEYTADFCGDFIFIRNSEYVELSLRDYLGTIYDTVSDISLHFGTKTADYSKEHSANWKLLVENVLECYHCTAVHLNSFAKMGYGFKSPTEFDHYNGHSWCEFPRDEHTKQNKLVEKVMSKRTYTTSGYKHFYIFPSTFISTVEGKGFYVGLMLPLSSTNTQLRIRYFSSKLNNDVSESDLNMINFINDSSNSSLDVILNEDKEILETIQSNIVNFPDGSPIFGNEEFRIIDFYNYYNSILKLV
jgi:phenylpropionate dioxygenase-like ring-hydroxylating dioxygenase large terminal subunit